MTPERLATLRAIRKFRGQITYEELANHLRIRPLTAQARLENLKPFVRKEGLGQKANYHMTKAGWEKLAYYEEHLEGSRDADG